MLKQLIRLFLCITTDLFLKPHTDRSFVIQQSHSSLCFISGVFFFFFRNQLESSSVSHPICFLGCCYKVLSDNCEGLFNSAAHTNVLIFQETFA